MSGRQDKTAKEVAKLTTPRDSVPADNVIIVAPPEKKGES